MHFVWFPFLNSWFVLQIAEITPQPPPLNPPRGSGGRGREFPQGSGAAPTTSSDGKIGDADGAEADAGEEHRAATRTPDRVPLVRTAAQGSVF